MTEAVNVLPVNVSETGITQSGCSEVNLDYAVSTAAVYSVWQLSWSPIILWRSVMKKIYYIKNSITFTQLHIVFTYKMVL